MLFEGSISVKSVLLNNKRKINKIILDKTKNNKDFSFIKNKAIEKNIEVIELEPDDINNLTNNKNFGGVLCDAENRKSDNLDNGSIFYLEGIEDPFNLGYIMRNLYAFGINNLVISERDYSTLDVQIMKSSAGAYDTMNILFYKDIDECLKKIKDSDYYFYALLRNDNSKDIFNINFNSKSVFMIGGEKRGLSSKSLFYADEYLYIPYGNDFRNSLNASNAVGVVSTLIFKQNKND